MKNSVRKISIYRCLIFLVLCCTNIYGKSDTLPPSDFDWDTINDFIKFGKAGILGAFLGDTRLDSNRNQLTFYSRELDSVEGRFLIGNYTGHKRVKYVLACFVDYQILNCFNDGSSETSEVTLSQEERKIIPIKFKVNGEYNVDFLIIGIPKTKNVPVISYRGVVITDKDEFKSRNPKEDESIREYLGRDLVEANNSKFEMNPEPVIERERSYLHIGNSSGAKNGYKIIYAIWFDGALKLVSDSSYYELQPRKSIALPIAEHLNKSNAFQAFVILNPYIYLEDGSGIRLESPTNIIESRKIKVIGS